MLALLPIKFRTAPLRVFPTKACKWVTENSFLSKPQAKYCLVWASFLTRMGLPFSLLGPSENLAVPVHTLREIDTLCFGSHIIDSIFGDVVDISCFSHHVDVFQWDRECFIIWLVKLWSMSS